LLLQRIRGIDLLCVGPCCHEHMWWPKGTCAGAVTARVESSKIPTSPHDVISRTGRRIGAGLRQRRRELAALDEQLDARSADRAELSPHARSGCPISRALHEALIGPLAASANVGATTIRRGTTITSRTGPRVGVRQPLPLLRFDMYTDVVLGYCLGRRLPTAVLIKLQFNISRRHGPDRRHLWSILPRRTSR
jgi:hypothetical protein